MKQLYSFLYEELMGEAVTEPLKYSDISSPDYGKRRLRINKTSDHSFLISRFNDTCETNKLNGPFRFIARDENSFSNKPGKESLNDTCHWLLKLSDHEKIKINNKSYISKKCNLDTDVFFVLVENEEYSDLFPISSWHTFETDISEKTLNKCNKEEINERWRSEKKEKDKKLDEILERLRLKEELEKPLLSRTEEMRGKKRKIRSSDSDEDDDDDDDDIHLEKQEKKKIKNLLKLKRRDDKDEIEYVNSALSIAALRKNMVDWDYSDDGKKSDDEDLHDVASAAEDVDDEEDNDNSEDDENVADSNLTCYGQAVRTLLKQQIDDEEDEELQQYSDDDDDDEEDEENEEPKEPIEKEDKKGRKRKRKESPEDKRKTKKKKMKQKRKHGKKKKKRRKGDDSDDDSGSDSDDDSGSDSDDVSDSDSDDEEEDDENDDNSEEDSDEESEGDSDDESDEESDDNVEKGKGKGKEKEKEKEKEKRKKQSSKTSEHDFNEAIREKFKKNKLQITKDNCAKIIYTIIAKNNGKMEISLLLNILNIKEKNQSFILVQKAIKTLCNISSQMKDNKKVKMVSVKPKYLKK